MRKKFSLHLSLKILNITHLQLLCATHFHPKCAKIIFIPIPKKATLRNGEWQKYQYKINILLKYASNFIVVKFENIHTLGKISSRDYTISAESSVGNELTCGIVNSHLAFNTLHYEVAVD